MIQSMTGYGRGTAGKGLNKVTSYIKVVNGRYLDIKSVSYTHLTLPTICSV